MFEFVKLELSKFVYSTLDLFSLCDQLIILYGWNCHGLLMLASNSLLLVAAFWDFCYYANSRNGTSFCYYADSRYGTSFHSLSRDGTYCKYWSLFSRSVIKQSPSTSKLVKLPYRNWKDGKEDFRNYDKTKYTQCLKNLDRL